MISALQIEKLWVFKTDINAVSFFPVVYAVFSVF